MKIYAGKSVSPMIAIGRVYLLKNDRAEVKKEKAHNPAAEIERLERARKAALGELDALCKKALSEVGEQEAQIFEIHTMMLEDEDYNDAIIETITKERVNAEYAVSVTCEKFRGLFIATGDSYMQEREADIRDISERLISCLTGKNTQEAQLCENAVICAADLTPTQTMALDKSRICAFVTAYGSENSHASILARTMNVPSVIRVGEEFLKHAKDGTDIIVDGFSGRVILAPNEEEKNKARQLALREKEKEEELKQLKGKEDVTKDGRRVLVFANITASSDIASVLENDASGIGLFRSEFLYLERSDYPDEEEQFEVYKKVLSAMGEKKVIIRTLDIGADKKVAYFDTGEEENPALGLRGIRLCFSKPEVFITQLKAIYRAAAYGNAAVMFPMIASPFEVERALEYCSEAKRRLCEEGKEYSEAVECGIMIETPAAAIISDILAPKVDFFSIGTNDLTQYTLACDRQNPKLDEFCNSHHDAVLRLIEMTAENAHRHGKWVGICGELAADTALTEEFVRMGIDELSVAPSKVLKLRRRIREI